MVEPKIFVAKWMILRTKIIPTILHHKKLTITVAMEMYPVLIDQGNLINK